MLMHDFEQPYQPNKPPNDVVHHAKKWGTKRSEYIYLLSIVAQKREYLVHAVGGYCCRNSQVKISTVILCQN